MDCVPLPVNNVPKMNRPTVITTHRDEDQCPVSRLAQSRVLNVLQETSFSDLDLLSDPLPTMCSSDGDIIDETKATRRIFSTVMARWPNSNEGTTRGFGRARDR